MWYKVSTFYKVLSSKDFKPCV